MFECPKCNQPCKQLVIPESGKIMACRSCVYPDGYRRSSGNVNLGQTVERWTHIDKKTGNEVTHRISTGKRWEIDNRRLSQDDGYTVVNRATGKPPEY